MGPCCRDITRSLQCLPQKGALLPADEELIRSDTSRMCATAVPEIGEEYRIHPGAVSDDEHRV